MVILQRKAKYCENQDWSSVKMMDENFRNIHKINSNVENIYQVFN